MTLHDTNKCFSDIYPKCFISVRCNHCGVYFSLYTALVILKSV